MRYLALLFLTLPQVVAAQTHAPAPDSAVSQVRTVLRAYYLNLDTRNWDALAAYVLSPKLLERRGAPQDSSLVWRDRSRSRTVEHAVAPPASCPPGNSAMIDAAAIRIDADWADVSVPRCKEGKPGVDEFRLLYFEDRWRFIYTDMF